MPFYLRKTIKAGPFRFNLSKSGVGLSVGVRGLRVGTGPRGHYIHAGANGFYYRASLGPRAVARHLDQPTTPHLRTPSEDRVDNGAVPLQEIESGDVLAMTDCRVQSVVDEINSAARRPRLSVVAPLAFTAIAFYASAVLNEAWPFIAIPVAFILGAWLDSFRRATVLFYDLSPEVASAYASVVESFQGLAQCSRLWHISAGGKIWDLGTKKRNAGADLLIKRIRTSASLKLPPFVRSNLDTPSLRVGKQELFFFPDFLLVVCGSSAGAISYPDLSLRHEQSKFIETEGIVADAKVVGRTWKYVNKKGGPDKRFRGNYEIPVCLYDVLHLSSETGLNELLEASKLGVMRPFAEAITSLAPLSTPAPVAQTRETASARRREWGPIATWTVLAALCAPAVVITFRPLVEQKPETRDRVERVVTTLPLPFPTTAPRDKQPVKPVLTTGSTRPQEPNATSLSKAFNVSLSFKIETGQAGSISGTTNLPTRTELWVIVRANAKVVLARSATVSDGSFAIKPFRIPPAPDDGGRLTVEVRSKPASVQPLELQPVLGPEGSLLRGPVKRGNGGAYASVSQVLGGRPGNGAADPKPKK